MQAKISQNRFTFSAAALAALIILTMLTASAGIDSVAERLEVNYESAVVVVIGEDPVPRVSVRALDASGSPVYAVKTSAEAADKSLADVTAYSAVTDRNGYASFSVEGVAEGDTVITFRTADGTASVTMPLMVRAEGSRAERPVASIGGITLGADAPKKNTVAVPAGSLLTLSCGTDGARIWYNLNDTCPCQDLVSRKAYDSPITVNEDSYFRITAYKPGLEYSERLNITVNVYVPGDVSGDGRVLAEDARLALRASAGLEKLTPTQTLCADATRDGNVLADDARLILRASAGLEKLN